jgi:5-enolpyruvylshikimate-3-phosphate synthase
MTADEVVKLISELLENRKVSITLEEEVNQILMRANRLDAWRAYMATATPDDPVVLAVNAAFAEDTSKPL